MGESRLKLFAKKIMPNDGPYKLEVKKQNRFIRIISFGIPAAVIVIYLAFFLNK